MDSESTRADVEAQLRETAEAMSDRFASLQDEVSTTSTSLRDWVARNPLKSVGGMLAAGVAVGALFGGGQSRRPGRSELLDQYIQALRTEVEDAIAAGDTPGEAVEKALQGRAPLVVYREGEGNAAQEDSGGSMLDHGLSFVTRLLAREVLQGVLLYWAEEADMEALIDEIR
ncbi:MAG: hypothetical protein BRD39_01560 [Bacteroidetes bacterium QH_9_64_21]|nr:MAG: hypothetical protein BRD39_01560 [Bacteroidetes bacterium QH_9_64_21]